MEIDYPPHLPQSPDTIAHNAAHPNDLRFCFRKGQEPVKAIRHRNPDGSVGGWVQAEKASVTPDCTLGPYTTVCDNACVSAASKLSCQASVCGTAAVQRCNLSENAKVSATSLVSKVPPSIMYGTTMWGSAEVLDFDQIRNSILCDEVRVDIGQKITILNSQLSGNATVQSFNNQPTRIENVTMKDDATVLSSNLANVDLSNKMRVKRSTLTGRKETPDEDRIRLSGDFEIFETVYHVAIEANDRITFLAKLHEMAVAARTSSEGSAELSAGKPPAADRGRVNMASLTAEFDLKFAQQQERNGKV
jgi:hypothetical protein